MSGLPSRSRSACSLSSAGSLMSSLPVPWQAISAAEKFGQPRLALVDARRAWPVRCLPGGRLHLSRGRSFLTTGTGCGAWQADQPQRNRGAVDDNRGRRAHGMALARDVHDLSCSRPASGHVHALRAALQRQPVRPFRRKRRCATGASKVVTNHGGLRAGCALHALLHVGADADAIPDRRPIWCIGIGDRIRNGSLHLGYAARFGSIRSLARLVVTVADSALCLWRLVLAFNRLPPRWRWW